MSQSFYLTTAISYVNAKPHIGHAYEFVGSDAICRYKRMQDMNVFFLSGVDEHSAKVEKSAHEKGMSPREYCDEMSVVFQDVHTRLGTQLDGFIRTSEPRHHDTTKDMLQRAYDNGDIYKSTYAGYYSVRNEAFIQEDEIEKHEDGSFKDSSIEWIEEENYFFTLSNYTEALKEHFEQHPEFVQPATYRNEMLALLERGLQDISISRTTTQWGIPLPWDEKHVSYVWFDALSNYLTGVGYLKDDDQFNTFWPADAHVIGKDINRFHSVFWPAMLMSAGIPLPKQVYVHGFIYHKGEKMSKSIGNVVDPLELLDGYGRDPLRYFMLREIAWGQDGNYSEDTLITRYNADLANDLGNLFSRVLSMMKKYRGSVVPSPGEVNESLLQKADEVRERYVKQMDAFVLHQALIAVWELIGDANKYVDEKGPWALAKDEARQDELDVVMYTLAETLRRVAIFIYPFMPDTSHAMLERMGCAVDGTPSLSLIESETIAGKDTVAGNPLFPRLSTDND